MSQVLYRQQQLDALRRAEGFSYTPGRPLRYGQHISGIGNYQEVPGSIFWYNPVNQKLYFGQEVHKEPPLTSDWNNFRQMPWVVDVKEHKRGIEREAKGELAAGEALYGGINQEFYPKVAEFMQLQRAYGTPKARELMAGVFSRADFPDLVATIQSIKMMLVTKPQHVIRDLFTTMATDQLTLKVGEFTDFNAIQENLGEFNVPYEGGKGAYSFTTMTLTKNAWHMAFSEEFGMTDYTQPVEAQHMNALNGQMDLLENQRVLDQITAVSGTAQGDWSAFTSNMSTRNPRPDIDATLGAIDDLNKSQATTILSSRKVFNAYRQNTYVNSSPSIVSNPPAGVQYIGRGNQVFNNVPLTEGLNWAVDSLVPTTWYAVFSPEAMIVANGPTRTAAYYDTKSGIRGTMYKKWWGAQIVYPELIARGTGVAS